MPQGSPITLAVAKSMIDENKYLTDNIESKADPSITDPVLLAKIAQFLNPNANAYVFSKAEVMRLFDNDAELLVVCPGAHPQNETVDGVNFLAGSYTTVLLGCKPAGASVEVINIAQPGSEFPDKISLDL